ncbi:MAG: LytTR family transcriptional regulator [Clostridia bacterium]|nr:LytTR family transcriptional regulator [Clostridia bacterium]
MKLKVIVDPLAEEEVLLRVRSDCDLINELESLVMNYNGKDSVAVFSDDEVLALSFSEIECITVMDRKTYVIDKDGKQYRVNRTLSSLEEILPGNFIKINKSSLANEKYIKCFKTLFSGAVDAIFKSGYREYVSRRCFAEIKRRLKNEK